MMISERWDKQLIGLALYHSRMSKDPETRVGAVIIRATDMTPISDGFNGFPRGIADDHRLNDRTEKLRHIVHAERNAVLNAARSGHATLGGTLYFAATDDTGECWGGSPCSQCVIELIQAGINEVVSLVPRDRPSKWHDDARFAETILREANINLRLYQPWNELLIK